MNPNIEVISYTVSLIIKATIVAARFSGRIRKRSLKRLAVMDIDEKDTSRSRWILTGYVHATL